MRKPAFAICEQQRRRSACASAQSDSAFVVRFLDGTSKAFTKKLASPLAVTNSLMTLMVD